MSPTADCCPLYTEYTTVAAGGGVGGCTRGRGGGCTGVGSWVGTREGYTGTQPQTSPRTHILHILRYSPTYGQMKAISGFHEVS